MRDTNTLSIRRCPTYASDTAGSEADMDDTDRDDGKGLIGGIFVPMAHGDAAASRLGVADFTRAAPDVAAVVAVQAASDWD